MVWLLIAILVLLPGCQAGPTPAAGGTAQAVASATSRPTATPTATPPPPTSTATPTPMATPPPTPPEPQATPTAMPGADLIAFETTRDGNAEVYLLNAETGETLNLTRHPADDRAPAWSPDGARIAFESHRDGNWEIYILDLNDGSLARVTENPAYDGAPAWSPDGAWLAFESYRDGNLEIYVVAATGGQPRRLTENEAGDYGPAWSPDGRLLAFTSWRDGNKEVYVVSPDGDQAHNVTHHPADDEDPAWTADGSALAFVSWREVDGETGNRNAEVYRVALADGAVGRLTDNPWPDLDPAWDAGGRLVWAAYDPGPPFETYDPYRPGDYHLYRADRAGGARRLTDTDGDDRRPAPVPRRVLSWDRLAGLLLPAPVTPAPRPTLAPGTLAQVVQVPGILVGGQPIQVNERVVPSLLAWQQAILDASGYDLLHDTLGSWRNLDQVRRRKLYTYDYGYLSWHKAGRALDLPLEYKVEGVDQMLVAREDLGEDVYWRMYLRTARQDGSQGEPLKDNPWLYWWHIVPREDPEAYDAGGKRLPIPAGYYVDVTALAKRYGWERIASYRIPGDYHWHTDSNGTEYWHYERTDGLTWWEAMRQIYPLETLEEHVGWQAGLKHAQSEAMMRSKGIPTPSPGP